MLQISLLQTKDHLLKPLNFFIHIRYVSCIHGFCDADLFICSILVGISVSNHGGSELYICGFGCSHYILMAVEWCVKGIISSALKQQEEGGCSIAASYKWAWIILIEKGRQKSCSKLQLSVNNKGRQQYCSKLQLGMDNRERKTANYNWTWIIEK